MAMDPLMSSESDSTSSLMQEATRTEHLEGLSPPPPRTTVSCRPQRFDPVASMYLN